MTYDIEMTTDDTVELDTIIENSSRASKPINKIDTNANYDKNDLEGIQTHTTIFDPPESGEYDIHVNGQVLSINVTDASAIPDSGVSHWDFENSNNDDSVVNDEWGTNKGTVNGATYVDSGGPQGSGAYSFDGDNDGIALDSNISFSSGDAWSLVVLAKVDTNRGLHRVVGKSGDDDNHIRFTPSSNDLGLEGDANGVGTVTHTYSDTYELYTVTHAATSGNVRFYVDDSDLGAASPDGTGFVLNNIGKGTSSSDIFQGECAGVWMYGRKLSHTEVTQLYNAYI